MVSHPVYTTLNVPTVTSYPSVKCLQWSGDGQACFATKTAAYLMTPDHGMTWSPQADFGLTPTPPVDGSLLIVGNRAGSLVFLRYHPNATVQHALTVPVTETWITHVSCEAFLASAAADGSVQIAKLTQSYTTETYLDPPEFLLTFEARETIIQPDKTSVTGWLGLRSFRLKTQKLSVGSSALHPASGIQYISRRDILVLTLFDGSFHVIYNLSGEPTVNPQANDIVVTSEKLSQAARSVFVQTENNVDFGDMNRITGLTSYDGSATFIWMQEASRPSDFSYKHDAKHNSTLLVSSLWNDVDDDSMVNELREMLDEAKTTAGLAPLYLLRPFFFHLQDRTRLVKHYPQILEILKAQNDDHSLLVNVPTWTSMTSELRRIFRTSLMQHLFGWDTLFSLRMRLSIADFVWKYIGDAQKQAECGYVAQDLLNRISHRVLRTIIRHLTAIVTLLTPNDIPFVLRMVVQSLLPGSPEDISAEGNRLQNMSQGVVYPNPEYTPVANTFNEHCPACKVEVPLQDITTAVCANGYVDEQLIGSGKVTRAAIVGLQRGVWASSSGYTLSADDETALISAVNSPNSALSNGLRLRGQKFFIVQTNDRSLYGKKQADGIVVVKTTQAILIAEYDQPLQAAETTPVVEKLADYLISVGY
ncbi:hypothetical protein C0992_007917 [Termitomyces sp. T32_za158]|nr:hypothetical protein C0992_007917 [Termitomyces sp. T32_za158]